MKGETLERRKFIDRKPMDARYAVDYSAPHDFQHRKHIAMIIAAHGAGFPVAVARR